MYNLVGDGGPLGVRSGLKHLTSFSFRDPSATFLPPPGAEKAMTRIGALGEQLLNQLLSMWGLSVLNQGQKFRHRLVTLHLEDISAPRLGSF